MMEDENDPNKQKVTLTTLIDAIEFNVRLSLSNIEAQEEEGVEWNRIDFE